MGITSFRARKLTESVLCLTAVQRFVAASRSRSESELAGFHLPMSKFERAETDKYCAWLNPARTL
jgi:hypothetical protein